MEEIQSRNDKSVNIPSACVDMFIENCYSNAHDIKKKTEIFSNDLCHLKEVLQSNLKINQDIVKDVIQLKKDQEGVLALVDVAQKEKSSLTVKLRSLGGSEYTMDDLQKSLAEAEVHLARLKFDVDHLQCNLLDLQNQKYQIQEDLRKADSKVKEISDEFWCTLEETKKLREEANHLEKLVGRSRAL